MREGVAVWFQRANGDERSVGAGSGENQRRFQDSQSPMHLSLAAHIDAHLSLFNLQLWPERWSAEDGAQRAEVMGESRPAYLRRPWISDFEQRLRLEARVQGIHIITLKQNLRRESQA